MVDIVLMACCGCYFRKQLEGKDEAQARLESLDRKHRDILLQISSMLHIETLSGMGVPSIEEITMKVNGLGFLSMYT